MLHTAEEGSAHQLDTSGIHCVVGACGSVSIVCACMGNHSAHMRVHSRSGSVHVWVTIVPI